MADAKLLKSIRNLLNNVRKFDDMPTTKQAGFRAQLTRVENLVADDESLTDEQRTELTEALTKVRTIVGEAETKSYRKQTPADLVDEYAKTYLQKSGKERGAFKAKLSRMLNTAKEDGDEDAVKILETLQKRIEDDATKSSWQFIRNMSKGLDELVPDEAE